MSLLVASAFLLGRLGATFSAIAVVVPLLMMSAANALAWPALTKAVMSSVPREQSGVAAGTFYALRNVGMSLSLTLALVVAESSLPRSIASQVFVGTAHVLSHRDAAALVHATDNGFTVFVAFYAVALLLALGLFRRVRSALSRCPMAWRKPRSASAVPPAERARVASPDATAPPPWRTGRGRDVWS